MVFESLRVKSRNSGAARTSGFPPAIPVSGRLSCSRTHPPGSVCRRLRAGNRVRTSVPATLSRTSPYRKSGNRSESRSRTGPGRRQARRAGRCADVLRSVPAAGSARNKSPAPPEQSQGHLRGTFQHVEDHVRPDDGARQAESQNRRHQMTAPAVTLSSDLWSRRYPRQHWRLCESPAPRQREGQGRSAPATESDRRRPPKTPRRGWPSVTCSSPVTTPPRQPWHRVYNRVACRNTLHAP